MKNLLFITLLFLIACNNTPPKKETNNENTTMIKNDNPIVFVGTYTQKLGHVDGKASGIYTCRLNPQTGDLIVVDSVAAVSPSFVCVSPDKKYLYAVYEEVGNEPERLGKVVSFKINDGGKLLKINELKSNGNAPCHVSTDKTGKFVFVANYLTGNILSFGTKDNGALADSICMKQHLGKTPWAHNVQATPDNKNVFAVDKGTDQIFLYELTANGNLITKTNISTATGAGPRHLDFNPQNPFQFVVINENNSTLGSFIYDGKSLKIRQLDVVSTLPKGVDATNNSGADVHFHPNGKFVYGSNRGHNSIVLYNFDNATGKLTFVETFSTQGEIPRNFMITPDGKLLLVANQNSSTVVSFAIDENTGKLKQLKINKVLTPVCLKML